MEDKVQEELGTFLEKMNEAVSVLSAKALEVAPEAYELTLNLIQFKGGFGIALGVLSAVTLLILIHLSRNCFRKTLLLDLSYEKDFFYFFLGYGFALMGGIALILSVGLLANFTSWLQLISPEGYLALQALEAVGINI